MTFSRVYAWYLSADDGGADVVKSTSDDLGEAPGTFDSFTFEFGDGTTLHVGSDGTVTRDRR